MYALLARQVLGDGMTVGSPPPKPHWCDYPADGSAFRDAMDRWREQLCPFLIRDLDGLDAWLVRGEVPAGAVIAPEPQKLDLDAFNRGPRRR